MKYLKIILEKYVQTIIEIIEIQQSYYFPRFFYLILFGVYLLQLTSYTYNSDETGDYSDAKLQFVSLFAEYSSVSYTLMEYGKDPTIISWFILLQTIIYSLLLYIAVISYLKFSFPRFYLRVKWYFDRINTRLNIVFTIYPWVFFLSFIETNSGILACGSHSFLEDYLDETKCIEKPFYFYFFSIFALIVSLIMCYLIFVFFRNRSFCEQNILRRRYNVTILMSTFLSFLVVVSYYLMDNISYKIKYIASMIVGALYIYDATINMPYSNLEMNKYVASTSCIFFISQIIIYIYLEKPTFMEEFDIFYSTAILSVVISGGLLVVIRKQFDSILKLQMSDLSKQQFIIVFLSTDIIPSSIFNYLSNFEEEQAG